MAKMTVPFVSSGSHGADDRGKGEVIAGVTAENTVYLPHSSFQNIHKHTLTFDTYLQIKLI